MLQTPYLVTLRGIAVKGVDMLSSGEQIMAYFSKGVLNIYYNTHRECVCK